MGVLPLVVIGTGFYFFSGNMDEFSQRIPEVEKSQFSEHSEDWKNLRYVLN